ncbi:MAG TPA: adenylosuccinate lyase family protein [Acidimicrobiales bacterium]|nr:adenylosuccinate lyase family protein [Acidimicrobiales bacterium]
MTSCSHERSQIADSRFHGHNYSTPASRRIFCDDCRIRRWIRVEAALAESEAELGLIPSDAAEAIVTAARSGSVDLDAIADGIRRTSHSLVAVLHGLQDACAGDAGQYVHYGATTQDIQDTGQALEMRDVLDEVDNDLRGVVARLAELARAERDTLMIGRTHARPALPITFGLKVAGWLDELLRHADRLAEARARVLVAQLAGGAGTMAAFGDRGPKLLESFATRLGLGVPLVGWHVARDRVAEYVVTLAMLAATLARIAEEVSVLARPELGELRPRFTHGHVGSSTMPHKRNLESCEQVVVLARLARSAAALALEAMVGEHERDGRSLRLEWPAVADVSHSTLAALRIVDEVLERLMVDGEHMAEQARRVADDICSEALMLTLAARMGKQNAHALVYELSQAAQSEGRSLKEAVGAHLAPEEVEAVFDPGRYLGSSGELVDGAVAAAEAWLGRR